MEQQEKLNHLRHSGAHLLAASVIALWPHAKQTIGPSIENGFYEDLDVGDIKISEDDLPKIENKMHELVKTWQSFERIEMSEKEARELYKDNQYKQELIDDIVKRGEPITIYKSGEYMDLCRGGHEMNPSKELKYFKLLKVAGAYWRGDEKNKMLTRIYGTAFFTKEELDNYLHMLEEAEKRDHKKLGKELDLFVFSDLVGPGLPLWTPKGTLLRDILNDYVWQLRKAKGYTKVEIPHITKKELYEISGHWDKFKDELFKIQSREGHLFAMKPMNCPHHIQIFNRKQNSYRDLPQRYATTTMVYRDEQTGELSGLSRVRAVTQDDAHVFARKSQVKEEFEKIWDIVKTFYSTFGFELRVRLSFHDPDNMKAYLGTQEMWKEAESSLEDIAKDQQADYFIASGEAAFYGPKVDFITKDSLGREWQVATIQLDINMPERFDLFCINEQGEKERIVMIHAAIMGSIERFLSVLIEHLAGNLPTWLSPVQVVLLPIADRHAEYAQKVAKELQVKGIRVEVDNSAERLQAKIRTSTLQKIPFMGIIGDKEIEAQALSVRRRNGQDLGSLEIKGFLAFLQEEIDKKIV